MVDRSAAHSAGRSFGRGGELGEGPPPLPAHLAVFFFSCCQVAGVIFYFFLCSHIMLFCSEFTSEEFSSPRTLWFSCLGVRELWMLRESSSLAGAFTGSSSLFWELGSSYPGRVRVQREQLEPQQELQTIRTSSKTTSKRKSPLYPTVMNPWWTILHTTV